MPQRKTCRLVFYCCFKNYIYIYYVWLTPVLLQEAFKKEIEHIQRRARRSKVTTERGFYTKEKMKTELKWSVSFSQAYQLSTVAAHVYLPLHWNCLSSNRPTWKHSGSASRQQLRIARTLQGQKPTSGVSPGFVLSVPARWACHI